MEGMKIMKKIVSIFAALSLLASSSTAVVAADREARNPDVFVDEKIIEFPDQGAYITNEGRTLVPARGVFEAMDCDVLWNAENYTVTVSNKGLKKEILLTINGSDMKVVTDGNEETKTLDVPAQLMNNRTMIPLRAVSEALGCDVGWNDDAYRVDIAKVKIEEKKPLTSKIYLKAPTTQVKAGAEIQIPVVVSDAKGLKGAMFKVTWDPKMLKIVDLDSKTSKGFPGYINQPDLFSEFCDVNSSDVENGTITVAGGASKIIDKESKDYSLGTLRFKVLAAAEGKSVAVNFDTAELKTCGNDGEGNVAFASAEGVTIQVKKETSSGGGGGGGGGSSRPSSGNKPSGGNSGSGSGGAGSGGTQEPDDPTPDNPDTPENPEDNAVAVFTIDPINASAGEEVTFELRYETTELVNIVALGAMSFSDANVEILGFEFSDEIKSLINMGLSEFEQEYKSVIVLFNNPEMFSGVIGTFRIKIPENASGEIKISAQIVRSKNDELSSDEYTTTLEAGSITVG